MFDQRAYDQRISADRAAVERCLTQDTVSPSDLAIALCSGLLERGERVAVVIKFLRTPAQRHALAQANISFDTLWKVRSHISGIPVIEAIYDEWNMRLGVICFRSRLGDIGDAYPKDKIRVLAPWPYLASEQPAQAAAAPNPAAFGTPITVIKVTSADVEALLDRHYGMAGSDAIALAGWEDDHEYLIAVDKLLSVADTQNIERFVRLGRGPMEIVALCLNELATKNIIACGDYLVLVRYL